MPYQFLSDLMPYNSDVAKPRHSPGSIRGSISTSAGPDKINFYVSYAPGLNYGYMQLAILRKLELQ